MVIVMRLRKRITYFLLVTGMMVFIYVVYNPDSNDPIHVLKAKGDVEAVKLVFDKYLSEEDRKNSDLNEVMEKININLKSQYLDYYGNQYVLKEIDGVIYLGTYGLDNVAGGEGESADYFAPLGNR